MPNNAPSPGDHDPLGAAGVIPPTVTAFDESDELDIDATAAHAQFVADAGANGVFPLGTNGEFPLLTDEERRQVVEAVADAVDVPVIAGVGAAATRTTVDHAEHAESVGADGVVAVTPYYYPLDEESAVNHYTEVADAVDIPVYIYHIPSKTGNELSLSAIDRLAEVDGIAGVKDSSKDVPWLAQAIDRNPELTFMIGSDSLLYPGLSIGCSGLISAIGNVFPELVVDLYEAYDAGEEERARELQSKAFEVRDALKRGPYMAGVKTALDLRDLSFDVGSTRAPLRMMSDEDEVALEDDLTSLGLL